jgi:hypothetical protein
MQLFASGGSATIAGVATLNGGIGDGGPASLARLSSPVAAMPDGSGGVWIADLGNNALRHVMPFSQCYQMGRLDFCVGINASFIRCTLLGKEAKLGGGRVCVCVCVVVVGGGRSCIFVSARNLNTTLFDTSLQDYLRSPRSTLGSPILSALTRRVSLFRLERHF